jgi:hypothetical protein
MNDCGRAVRSIVALTGLACSASSATAPQAVQIPIAPPGATTTEYGDGASRATAYNAFTGKRAPVALAMTRYTVEGQPIYFSIQTQMSVAVLTVDERKDGGTVRTDTLKSLAFARYIPGRFVNGVEVEKDRLEVADPNVITPGTIYILVEPACLTGPCTHVF